jgi:hypothetical protein
MRPDLTALPELRLVEVPDGAPPFDCPVHGACCPERRAARPVRAAPVTAAAVTAAAVTAAAVTARPVPGPPAAAVPAAATALAVMIAETLAGVRPERQLAPLTTDRVRARIRGLGPLLRCGQRPRVQRIVASRPAAPVVEMTMVVTFGPRSRALALRLEQAEARPATPGRPARTARWRCTALEAG